MTYLMLLIQQSVRTSVLALVTFCSTLGWHTLVSANDLPIGFEEMEIEAKWDTDEPTFNAIVSAFVDGSIKYDHELEVRWSSIPRRYVDVYYDNASNTLDSALHVFRHRQRSRTSTTISIGDTFSTLGSTAWNAPDWEKVQYKSTPTRLAAVWFRDEKGNAQLNSAGVDSTLDGVASPLYPPGDNPIDLLLADHPGFNFSTLNEVLTVTQYRYRVELKDTTTGQAIYELSMDKVLTQLPGQSTGDETFAVEMELLADTPITAAKVDFLFDIMLMMEDEFSLTRSASSKAGTVVEDSAEPVLRVETPIIDYGNVQTGFSFSKPLEIYNDGLADLDVTLTYPTLPDSASWPAHTGVQNHTVPVGNDPILLGHVYVPQSVSSHSILVNISSNDEVAGDAVVSLQGTGIPPTPIDSVLLLDRSGSMSASAGERTKIDVMRDAVDLYIHLLRDEIPGSSETDTVGMVKYNNTSDEYLALAPVDDPSVAGSHMANAQNLLIDSALADPLLLLPDDATGIGGAMQRAAGMFTVPAGDREPVMILLTDGIENRSPFIDDVRDPILLANPDLNIYSIGVGDHYDGTSLQSITNLTGGYHQVSGELTGTSLFDLENFYFKIFAHVNGMSFIVDPTFMVPANIANSTIVDTADVTSSDHSIVFLVLENPVLRQFYKLELISPTGETINKASNIAGEDVKFVQRHTYTTYKFKLPDIAKSKDYIGTWKLQLTPNGKWNPETIKTLAETQKSFTKSLLTQAINGLMPIGFSAAVVTDYKLDVNALTKEYLPGNAIKIVAELSDRGIPVTSAKVSAQVSLIGSSTTQRMIMFDDGTNGDDVKHDGKWTAFYKSTEKPGTYRFLVRTLGRNALGETVSREQDVYVSMLNEQKERRSGK